ncbi:MAG: radical SAM family heme chaperone HemW [Deltaproteobacteria bacterium]|nr:radical SAM family heme chaperone HemW [Deltaproteobacteria bacterium]
METSPDPAGPGLYVHVPFCVRKCPYCDFYSERDFSRLLPVYFKALALEAEKRAPDFPEIFDTLYLGGGSPSLLAPDDLLTLKEALKPFGTSFGAEVTLEANPEDVTEEKAEFWKEWGATRVSLGVQSFSDRSLRVLGRTHGADKAKEALAAVLSRDLNPSLDLIFGMSGQTPGDWEADLVSAVGSGAGHVSAYALTPAPGTALAEGLADGSLPPLPDEETMAELFSLSLEILGRHGFRRYEVSNFARPGHESRHNLKYWRRANYLGLGPSAASLKDGLRSANPPSLSEWSRLLFEDSPSPRLLDVLTPERERTERVMLGFRTEDGVSPRDIGPDAAAKLKSYVDGGFLVKRGERLVPTEKGFLIADRLALDLS